MNLPRLGGFDRGNLNVRNGAASPATTIDSLDLGGPTAWAMASYMSTFSAPQQEEPQSSADIEPASTFRQPTAPEQTDYPVTRGSGRSRGWHQRTGALVSIPSENIMEDESRAQYSFPATQQQQQQQETPTESSQISLPLSPRESVNQSSPRSSGLASREHSIQSDSNTLVLDMHNQAYHAPTSTNLEETVEQQVATDTKMSSIDDIPRRQNLHSQPSSPTCSSAFKPIPKAGVDSGYSSGCSVDRTSQDTFLDNIQRPTSREHSITDLSAMEGGVGRPPQITESHITPKPTLPSNIRSRRKIEKITGESLESLNLPNIGNKTQKVNLPQRTRSQIKLEKITGESLESLSYPVVGVIPQWQTNLLRRVKREERKSAEHMEPVAPELVEEVKRRRSRSLKGSKRDSLQILRSAPNSRPASPERELSDTEHKSSTKQQKKLQKRRPSSKPASIMSAHTMDNVHPVPIPVNSQPVTGLDRLPATNADEQFKDTITSKLESGSMNSSEHESTIEHETPARAVTRRPSIFRRGRKRDMAPKEEKSDLIGVVVDDSALSGSPYDIALSTDNRKTVDRQRSLSAGPKSPHHFANLPRPGSHQNVVTEGISSPISAPKRDLADLTRPTCSANQSPPPPEVTLDAPVFSKRASVWTREVVAAANRGLPAELPAALVSPQPPAPPVQEDLPVELSAVVPVELPGSVPVELEAVIPTERLISISKLRSAEPVYVENQRYPLEQHLSWTSGRQTRQAFHSSYQNFSRPQASPTTSAQTTSRPCSSPATTIFYASRVRPAITFTSASPSPPPSPSQSPQRRNSAGNLSSIWKQKQNVSLSIERETAEWSRQAQIWRERHLQARARAQQLYTVAPMHNRLS
jgi:hypothetical protein